MDNMKICLNARKKILSKERKPKGKGIKNTKTFLKKKNKRITIKITKSIRSENLWKMQKRKGKLELTCVEYAQLID